MASPNPVHTIVLDTGSIIRNEPSVSNLINQSEHITTIPAIISEIKDSVTRARVESTLLPFLNLRSPSPASIRFVTDFARRTGDIAVLSKPDIHIIALAYEIECERNGGDWRLRRVPGQKRVNGAPPSKVEQPPVEGHDPQQPTAPAKEDSGKGSLHAESVDLAGARADSPEIRHASEGRTSEITLAIDEQNKPCSPDGPSTVADISQDLEKSTLDDEEDIQNNVDMAVKIDSAHNSAESQDGSTSDSEGWITPSNVKRKKAEDAASSVLDAPESKTMQVAVLTTDFAMQNVILQMNLNLLSPSLTRIKHLKNFVLRCHACFQVTKDMNKQFCPRCGQPSLTRVSCSTNANGEFKLHLKKNMQWNHRGDKYSIPKPTPGSANGRVKGGGKGGWGNDLILAEDQKEYQRAAKTEKKMKEKNLMDEDYLPSILTGDRGRAGGRPKVGAGKNVNSRKR